MQLTLKEAATLITEMSGVELKKASLLYLCKKNKIKHDRIGIYHVVDLKEAKRFAKKFNGIKTGRPRKK